MKRKVFFYWVLFLLLFTILNILLGNNLTKPISHLLKDLSIPFYRIPTKIIDPNQKDFEITIQKEQENEIIELKKLLNLEQKYNQYHFIHAGTIFQKESFQIDKGKKEGVEIGLPVIVEEGLVGIIQEVGNHTSSVSLLTKEALPISVKIEGEEPIYGVLSNYDSEKGLFQITGISDQKEIKEGSIVSTSGMGSHYPNGILIGKTATVHKDHFDLSQSVDVKSQVSFQDLHYVSIIKKGE